MKKWIIFYWLPLAVWIGLAQSTIRSSLHVGIHFEGEPVPHTSFWLSEVGVSLWPGAFAVVMLVVIGVANGQLRPGEGQPQRSAEYLVGCALLFVGLTFVAVAVMTPIAIGLKVAAYLLVIPMLILPVQVLPIKVKAGAVNGRGS